MLPKKKPQAEAHRLAKTARRRNSPIMKQGWWLSALDLPTKNQLLRPSAMDAIVCPSQSRPKWVGSFIHPILFMILALMCSGMRAVRRVRNIARYVLLHAQPSLGSRPLLSGHQ